MEKRLTECFELGFYVDKSNIVDISQVAGQFFEKGAYMGKAIDKLGAFEDFMESLGCEELEELEHLIGYPRFVDGYDKQGNEINRIEFVTYKESFNEVFEKNKKLKQENQALKDRWEKLKKYIADTKPLRGTSIYFLQETLLDKMNELEKGDANENR